MLASCERTRARRVPAAQRARPWPPALRQPAGGKRLRHSVPTRCPQCLVRRRRRWRAQFIVTSLFIIAAESQCRDLRNYYRFWHHLACANAYGRRVLNSAAAWSQKTESDDPQWLSSHTKTTFTKRFLSSSRNFRKSIHDAAMHHFMFTWSQIKPPWRHPGLNT